MFLYRYKASRLLRPLVSGSLCAALMLVGLFVPHTAQANIADLTVAPYDSCTASTANGVATFKMRAHLTSAIAFLAGRQDLSTWGVAVFFYDSQGNIKATPADANLKVSMNQTASVTTITYPYYRSTRVVSGPASNSPALKPEYANSWHNLNAYTAAANLEITVNSNSISEFPGIGVSIALRNTSQTVHMDKRTAYLAVDTTGLSTCNEITTGTKPPQPPKPPAKKKVTITVTDMDFGDLSPTRPTDPMRTGTRLCFSDYEPFSLTSEKLQLHVTNQNGTTGGFPNMFKLVHTSDPSATIPYNFRVDMLQLNGVSNYDLPNNTPHPIESIFFAAGQRLCYTTQYKTQTTSESKPGDYMDTLTFTVSNIP